MRFTISSIIISLLTLLSKVSGFIRDLFLASFFGATNLADIFFFSMKIPYSIKPVVADENFNASYLKISTNLESQKEKDEFSKKILSILILFFLPLVLMVEIYMPYILEIIAAGKRDDEEFRTIISTSRIIFPSIFFISTSAIFISMLYERNKFTLVSALPIITSLLIILAVITYNPLLPLQNITFIALSVLVASFLQMLILMFGVHKSFWTNLFSPTRFKISLKNFFNIYLPLCASALFLQATNIYYLYLNSFQEGAISWIYYAERLYFLPISLIAIPLSTVMIPNLARLIITNIKEASALQEQAIKYFIVSVLPLSVFLFFISDTLISFLFERGKFTNLDSLATAHALKFLIIGMPAFCFSILLKPYFFALGKGKLILYFSLFSSLFGAVCATLLSEKLLYLAIPLGISITSWMNAILYVIFHSKRKFITLDKG